MMSFLRFVVFLLISCGVQLGAANDSPSGTWAPDKTRLHEFSSDFGGEIQAAMSSHYRKGDVVISVPDKSGTTWTMNIVHQIRSGGDPDLRDIYEQVRWLEMWETPYQSLDDLLESFAKAPTWFPHAFKTHSAIGTNNLDYRRDLKYIVVMRNPTDAVVSVVPFAQAITKEFIDYWDAHEIMSLMNFKDAEEAWASEWYGSGNHWVQFLKSFWKYHQEDNVLVLHYADMVKNHTGTVRKVATFLGYDLPLSTFDRVCEYTSFAWMKEHGDKFSFQHVSPVPIIQPGGMVRKGEIGGGKRALSPEVMVAFEELLSKELTEEQATWLTSGGILPS